MQLFLFRKIADAGLINGPSRNGRTSPSMLRSK